MWQPDIIFALFLVGAFAGLMSGLFGIGGGMIVVPIVLWLLAKLNIDSAYTQHIAVGTSFAIMMFTTFSSALAQHKKKAVEWSAVIKMSPAMVVGGLLGSFISRHLSATFLHYFFIVFVILVGLKILFKLNPKTTRPMPATPIIIIVGLIIGILSSWVGIGGGTLIVPFLLFCSLPIHRAVGTSSALAWPMAVSGAIGYLITGLAINRLPEYSFGFWYLPAVAILACCTTIFAPIGVKLAHHLPAERLKMGMGLLILGIGLHMLYQQFSG